MSSRNICINILCSFLYDFILNMKSDRKDLGQFPIQSAQILTAYG